VDDDYALLTREHKRRIVSERLLGHESEHYDTRLDIRQLQSEDLDVPHREEQLATKLAKLSALEVVLNDERRELERLSDHDARA
jgi:hypothetical protein